MAYIKNNTTKRPCARQGVRGVFNMGQTCYMNAILQTLLHDPIFSNYFLGNGHQHDGRDIHCVGCAFTDVVAESHNYEKQEAFAALSIVMASWTHIPVSG